MKFSLPPARSARRGSFYFLSVAAALFLSFHGNLKAAPDWVSGQSRRYPSDKYIIGVGSGETMEAARDASRAEIAKVFKVTLEQISVETSAERSVRKASGGLETVSSAQVEQKTVAKVADTIEGTEIAQVWYDRKEKVYRALAVLEKAAYRRSLSARITDSEEKVMRSLETARASESFAEKLKNLTEALLAARSRDALYARRRVVDDFPSEALPDDLSSASIEDEIAAARGRSAFRMSPADETSGQLSAELSARLVKLGFAVASPESSASAELAQPSVEVSFEVAPFSRGQSEWKYYRWAGRFEVRDSGKIVITAAASGSESNPDDAAAFEKARRAGLKVLGDLFERKIKSDFLGGE